MYIYSYFDHLFGGMHWFGRTRQYYQLVILRALQSVGSSSTIAIGAGVIGDLCTREERGGYMGIFQAGLIAPLAIGPILGGALAERLGWRSIFWFLTIYGAVILILVVIFLPETLRILVGNGSIPPRGYAKNVLQLIKPKKGPITLPITPKNRIDIFASLRILVKKNVTLLVIFLSLYYTAWQMTVTAMSSLFQQIYHIDELFIGLTYIANGVGSILGSLLTGKYLDWYYKKIRNRNIESTEFPLEKARFNSVWIYSLLQIAAILIFGWTVEHSVHISIPIICTFVIGWTASSIQSAITTYLVDIYPSKGASATAALNFARCLIGAGGTAAILPIVNAINIGWAFTLVSGILLLSLSLIVIQIHFGPRWRSKISSDNMYNIRPKI